MGPALMPFLRYRRGDRWWRLGLGCGWLPLMLIVITIEDWMHVPQAVGWMSIGALFLAFVAFVLLYDRLAPRA